MIFTRANIGKISAGEKTETRRIWKRPHVRVGGVYRVRSSRRLPADPADPQIRVTDLRSELLGEITAEAVLREGCSSLEEFVLQWQDLHGEWDPKQAVYIVDFEVVP
ncbi:MAG TPA: ASCH domain-containing protein [Thermoplasmata archaeon]|nr:ASCH domain-containing protein [Thermoplasmata archaeon]